MLSQHDAPPGAAVMTEQHCAGEETLLDRAYRLAVDLEKLGDYTLALKRDDPRGLLHKEAADTMRQLADHIAFTG
jgi:hypothetical protein